MAETYDFELKFTGLCIITFSPAPRTATQADVLLVDATHANASDRHVPRLAFNATNLKSLTPPDYEVTPLPDGTELGSTSLENRWLEIEVTGGFQIPALTTCWRPDEKFPLDTTPDPDDRSQEDWLDWVMALKRMNPETCAPKNVPPYDGLLTTIREGGGGTRKTMIAGVKVAGGSLKAADFLKNWDAELGYWSYQVWGFDPDDGSTPPPPPYDHAMAGSVQLTIPGIPVDREVVLRNSDRSFEAHLQATRQADGSFEDVVRSSITNLPDQAQKTGNVSEYLEHFRHFYEPVTFNPPVPRLRLPHRRTSVVTVIGSFCPPVSHTSGD